MTKTHFNLNTYMCTGLKAAASKFWTPRTLRWWVWCVTSTQKPALRKSSVECSVCSYCYCLL